MESRTITVEGLRTRVLEESGDGATGDPILLVHGVGGWAENWRAVIGPLAASGRRVVALDLPGFGASARPGRVRYFSGEKAFYPRFVIGAMDVLGFSRAHLGGQSMGGAIVARSSSYRGPALVVWGREDRVLPIAHLESLPHLLPDAEVRIVERCGHLVMAECPDEFLDAALPFLERAERMPVAGPAGVPDEQRALAGAAGRRDPTAGTIEGG